MNGVEPLIVRHLLRVEPVPHYCACAEQQQQPASTTVLSLVKLQFTASASSLSASARGLPSEGSYL